MAHIRSINNILSENVNIQNNHNNGLEEEFDAEFEDWIKNNTDISEKTLNKITLEINKDTTHPIVALLTNSKKYIEFYNNSMKDKKKKTY